MNSKSRRIRLTAEERQELEQLRRRHGDDEVAGRAKVILMRASDATMSEICTALNISRPTVRKWIDRYARGGGACLGRSGTGLPAGPIYGPLTIGLPLQSWGRAHESQAVRRDAKD